MIERKFILNDIDWYFRKTFSLQYWEKSAQWEEDMNHCKALI